MKKLTRTILNRVSKIDINTLKNYEKERLFHDIMGITFRKNHKYFDTRLLVKDHTVGLRVFLPKTKTDKLIIYIHGGGWVVGSANNYTRICSFISENTNSIVVSIDYRLAPEYPFPNALIDCYNVVKHFYSEDNILGINKNNITIMGDSAGGNLTSVISIIARETKKFKIKRQILIYPLTYYDHSDNSPFNSVKENGDSWLLTTKRINEYMKLYVKDKKYLTSHYVAPLLAKKLKKQPKTLIITAEYDPLRDEGEAYGYKLRDFKNVVYIHRIKDTIHGFLSLPSKAKANIECLEVINSFLNGDDLNEKKVV